jgi:hypothetical protein
MSGVENTDKQQQLFNFTTALNEYSGAKYPLVIVGQRPLYN